MEKFNKLAGLMFTRGVQRKVLLDHVNNGHFERLIAILGQKGVYNPDYIKMVNDAIDEAVKRNPEIKQKIEERERIAAATVTNSVTVPNPDAVKIKNESGKETTFIIPSWEKDPDGWLKAIEDYNSQGYKIDTLCQAVGISRITFYNRRKKVNKSHEVVEESAPVVVAEEPIKEEIPEVEENHDLIDLDDLDNEDFGDIKTDEEE